MKKTNKLFLTLCLAGGFAMLFSSCKKDEEIATTTITLPTFEEEVDGRAYINFLNNNAFTWEKDDMVVVYNLDDKDGTKSEKAYFMLNSGGGTTAEFANVEGDRITEKKYGFFVFYPSWKVSEGPLNELNYETFYVYNTQYYTLIGNDMPTIDPEGMALAIDVETIRGNYTLKHIFGALRVNLKGTGVVTSIEVVDDRFNLCGSVSMKLHEVKMNTFSSLQDAYIASETPYEDPTFANAWNTYKETLQYTTDGQGQSMKLDCGDGIELSGTDTPFYIGLRPGALKYGFKVKVTIAGENEPRVFDYTGNNNIHYGIKAGKIKTLNHVID